MPPTPAALLMTALALLRLPACSGFRMARFSEASAGDKAEGARVAVPRLLPVKELPARAAAAGSPGAAPAKKKKSVAWVEGTSDALTC